MRPTDFILRCYGYKDERGKWCAVCLDFNIAAEADSPAELHAKMGRMIESYVATVLDTADGDTISPLLRRRAPLLDWAYYYLIRAENYISKITDRMTFDEVIPFKLAHDNG